MYAGVEYFGTYTPSAGTRGDAALGVYGSTAAAPSFTYGTRADSLAGSDVWAESAGGWTGEQGVEVFSYTPTVSGEFLLWLYQKGTQSVTGSLLLEAPSLVGVGAGAGRAAFVAPWPSPTRRGQSVRFAFDVPAAGPARLVVIDARGRAVRVVTDAVLPAGPASFTWDGRARDGAMVPAGLYFARLERVGLAPAARRFVRLD